jgi:hypothetical protein
MIGPPTWVYSSTVGDSTAGVLIFPRRRGRARLGALHQEFREEYLNLGGNRGGTKLVPKFRGYPVRQYRCRLADEPSPRAPGHHPVHLTPHHRLDPRAAGSSLWVSLRAPCARSATARSGWASRRPISKIVQNSVFLRFSEVLAHSHTVPLQMPRRARHADGWG